MSAISLAKNWDSFLFRATDCARRSEQISSTDSAICDVSSFQIGLHGEIAPGWMLARLLPITLDRDEDGFYIASDDEFYVYGYGATPDAARQDYIASLIEYYQILAEKDDSSTQAMFRRLRSCLRNTSC